MEPKATIVHKLPKQTVPDEYLVKVLVENKAGFGFAGQEDGKVIKIENTKSIMLSEVKELMKSFENNHLVMYFTNGGVIPDDVQPYTVSNGEDDPIHHLAMFYEGDFSKFAGMDGEHSGVYCVYDAEIAPKISSLFVESGKDWAKTFAAMRGEKWQRIIGNYFSDRGVFVILPPTGDPISFGKNDIGGQFQWGNVSNTHGYTVKAAVVPTEESGLSFLRGKVKTAMSTTAPAAPITPPNVMPPIEEKPPSEGHPQITRKDGEDIETKVVDGVTYTKMRPPKEIRGNKKANNAWLRCFNNGGLDVETQKNQFVWVPAEILTFAQRAVKSKDEVERMEGEIRKLKRPPNVTKAERTAEEGRNHLVGNKEPVKSTVRETVAEAAEKNKSAADFLPILDNDQREKALNRMAAFTSKGKRLTGLEIQKMEVRWPTFSEDIGVSFQEMLERPVDELLELFDGNKIAVCAFIEMRSEYYRIRTIAQTANLDISKPTKEDKKPAKADDGGLNFLRGKSAA